MHTDHNIDGQEKLAAWVTGVLEQSLGAIQERISRIEVHLTDETGCGAGWRRSSAAPLLRLPS